MSSKALYVRVNPTVLRWGRETIGLAVDAVAKRLDVSTTTVEGWEHGVKRPTLKSLKELAYLYKRPLAALFLPEPPAEPPLPTDFRVLPEERKPSLSKRTRLAIRRARRVQSLAAELLEMGVDNLQPIAIMGAATSTEDPEVVASRERTRLGIAIDDQLGWKDDYSAFNKWRRALEEFRILVLQARIPVEEARGFSLADDSLPVIVVSISDSIRARIFTLFHEYGHLLIGTSGICIPNETSYEATNAQRVEKFCNHFAGALLVPRDSLYDEAKGTPGESELDDSHLDEIAARFKVSRAVIVRRMLICGLISRHQYDTKVLELQYFKASEKAAFGVSPARRCLLENGPLFTSLAIEARDREIITDSDLSDYLSINLKHLDKLEASLGRH